MNAAAAVDNFTWLAELGYGPRLIPVVPPGAELSPYSALHHRLLRGEDARGKAPGTRGRGGLWHGLKDWQDYATSDEDLARWALQGANAGIRTGDGLAAIDADAWDPDIARRINAELRATTWGERAPVRIGRMPKALYVVRTETDTPYACIQFGLPDGAGKRQRVEALSRGRQFVASGAHPAGRAYWWHAPLVRLEDLPFVTAAELSAWLDQLREWLPGAGPLEVSAGERREVGQEGLLGDRDQIAAALARIPNGERFATRESYLAVGYALKAALGEDGRELFDQWCGRWTEGSNDPEVVGADWRRMKPPYRRGAGWLHQLAEECSGGAYRAVTAFHEEPDLSPAAPIVSASIFPSESVDEPAEIRATPFDFSTIPPPRKWVYGRHYVRSFLSATVAATKVGKTALSIAEALSATSGKPLLGVTVRSPRRAWLWNGEDPLEEMQRRVLAAMKLHGLAAEDIGGRLFLDSGRRTPIVMATTERGGARIAQPVKDAMIRELQKNRIDMLVIDPFVSSHRISENDNNAIDLVAKTWAQIADAAACSIDLVHHIRKLGSADAAPTLQDARGASSLLAAVRSSRALAKMEREEAGRRGLGEGWRRLFRLADVDMSMALPDALGDERWFELASVGLNNGDDEEPAGDDVGAVRIWESAENAPVAATDAREVALDMVRGGEWRRDPRAGDAWVGCAIAQAFRIDRMEIAGKRQIEAILREMFRDGTFTEETRVDATTRKRRQFVAVAASSASVFD